MADTEGIRAALAEHGRRRRAALEQAEAELAEIYELAPAALEAGLTKVEVGELGAVSRPALDAFLSRTGRADQHRRRPRADARDPGQAASRRTARSSGER